MNTNVDDCAPRRRPIRMCLYCELLTDEPVLVASVHQASGPGFGVYACPQCVEAGVAVPYSDL